MSIATRAGTFALVALVALATAGAGARVLLPRMGDAIARVILAASAVFPRADAPAPPERADRVDAATRREASHDPPSRRTRTIEGLEIPAGQLATLTARQLRSLHATDDVDQGGQVRGARLSGVGGLGVGLVDGDVVTSIDGKATPTADEATRGAFAAYSSGEATARATVLRGGRTLRVTVHIPARDSDAKATR